MTNEQQDEGAEATPVEPTLPTRDEIKLLPRWAEVAFAARCARRVQILFVSQWPDAPREHIDAVDRAIAYAELSAAAADAVFASFFICKADSASYSFVAGADAASDAANAAAASLAAFRDDAEVAAGAAARAAAVAADNAAACGAAESRPVYITGLSAADAAAAAVAAADNAAFRAAAVAHRTAHPVSYTASSAADAAARAIAEALNLIRRDYLLLLDRAKKEGWNDQTKVPPEVFGPMWPDGEPEGWPWPIDQAAARPTLVDKTNSAVTRTLSPPTFFIVWDPELVTEDDYSEIVEALSELVAAEGAAGVQRVRSREIGLSVSTGVPHA